MLLLYVQNEIEVALRHNGTGYVALGWRPSSGIDGTCRAEAPGNFPLGMYRVYMCDGSLLIFNYYRNSH